MQEAGNVPANKAVKNIKKILQESLNSQDIRAILSLIFCDGTKKKHSKRKEGKAMRNAILLLILSMLLACGAGCTDTGKYAVSAKGSTLGLGGEFTTSVASNVNARVGLNMLDIDFDDQEIEDVEFDLGIDLSSYSALVDWYAFNSSFRISGGIISMDNEVDLEARGPSGETVEIGDVEYDWSDVGTLYGSIESDEVAPYIGIGWGNPLTHSRRWGFTCDFGVAFTDTPDVTIDARGGIEPAGFRAELAKLQDDIEDFFDKFKMYPVIAVSFFYRF